MKKIIEIDEKKINKYLESLFDYFKNGYEFEEFLKFYLTELGLDEVVVTKRSKDGGIDLMAVRPGIGDFSDEDKVHYYIQAKRNKINSKVPIKELRALRGVLPPKYKGIFITTAKFTANTISEAKIDETRPIILIDGKKLIESCIEHEIGFVFEPVFSRIEMDNLTKEEVKETITDVFEKDENNGLSVDKMITANDIRARILSVPSIIMENIDKNKFKIDVLVNNQEKLTLSVNHDRNYLAGVTDFYKKMNLITSDGMFNPTKVTWIYDNGVIKLFIKK